MLTYEREGPKGKEREGGTGGTLEMGEMRRGKERGKRKSQLRVV